MRVPKPQLAGKKERSWGPDFYTLDDIYIGMNNSCKSTIISYLSIPVHKEEHLRKKQKKKMYKIN